MIYLIKTKKGFFSNLKKKEQWDAMYLKGFTCSKCYGTINALVIVKLQFICATWKCNCGHSNFIKGMKASTFSLSEFRGNSFPDLYEKPDYGLSNDAIQKCINREKILKNLKDL